MFGISIQELLHIPNAQVIDIRDNYSYQQGHYHQAKNIPYYSLLSNYSFYLNKTQSYYLYCDYGKQSMEISNRLNQFGYNTFYVKEGYLDFKNYLK